MSSGAKVTCPASPAAPPQRTRARPLQRLQRWGTPIRAGAAAPAALEEGRVSTTTRAAAQGRVGTADPAALPNGVGDGGSAGSDLPLCAQRSRQNTHRKH